MSSPYQGFIVKSVLNNLPMPLQHIAWESFKITPNQREETKAYRDENTRDLTRVTADGMKTAMECKTRPLWLEEMNELQTWINTAIPDDPEYRKQRKLQLEYWDPEENAYKQGWFYISNLDFTIIKTTDTRLKYKEQTIKMVEY